MASKDPSGTWRSALGVVAALAVFIGLIGLALWYANQLPVSSPALEKAQEEVRKSNPTHKQSPGDSWGIVHDSPIRKR